MRITRAPRRTASRSVSAIAINDGTTKNQRIVSHRVLIVRLTSPSLPPHSLRDRLRCPQALEGVEVNDSPLES